VRLAQQDGEIAGQVALQFVQRIDVSEAHGKRSRSGSRYVEV
jgi:hypothetical protein